MQRRQRIATLMIGICMMAMTVMALILYRQNIKKHQTTPQSAARSQTRIEAGSRNDSGIANLVPDKHPNHDASAASLVLTTSMTELKRAIKKLHVQIKDAGMTPDADDPVGSEGEK